jgi:type II secretory pathway component PulJ
MRTTRALRAFTLTEIIFALGLMGAAGVISAKLFTASMRSIQSSRAVEDREARLQRLTAAIHQDIWAAVKIESPDARGLSLTRADGTKIQWRFSDADALRAGDVEQRWPIDSPLQVEVRGAAVVLRNASDRGDRSEQWRFINPAKAMERQP